VECGSVTREKKKKHFKRYLLEKSENVPSPEVKMKPATKRMATTPQANAATPSFIFSKI
jgi:hypothetical protein